MRPRLFPVLQIVLGALIAVALVILGLGALLPRGWHVERSIMIHAPPSAVHAWVSDLRHWPRWAQWNSTALFPQNRVGDPSAGPGATLTWTGTRPGSNEETRGTVRIVESDPARGVAFEIQVQDEPPSSAALRYEPGPGVTLVQWTDRGRLPPVVGGLLLDEYQQRLGRHMEQGLTRLKDLVERGPPG